VQDVRRATFSWPILYLYVKNIKKLSDCTVKITEVNTNYEASVFNHGNLASTSRPETFLSTYSANEMPISLRSISLSLLYSTQKNDFGIGSSCRERSQDLICLWPATDVCQLKAHWIEVQVCHVRAS
jgi:hypothetical protein